LLPAIVGPDIQVTEHSVAGTGFAAGQVLTNTCSQKLFSGSSSGISGHIDHGLPLEFIQAFLVLSKHGSDLFAA
jgi:hypothetical protein